MSLRDSLDLIAMVKPEAGTAALDNEIMAERASSLGAAEAKVIAAMSALAAAGTDNTTALAHGRSVVWAYFVQRELIGFRQHTEVVQSLNIPPEVIAGLGAIEKRQ
ncbi:DUF6665 family protein [Devosia neptuniae]|uniref:DUF6665 family protein n=1 Tax=Devosia TaxID=46913 RepID=UPI0022AFEC58|nr:DUF6665 family protein [Devosia neptuniae]MCZ4345934.1 hypothetical protein [Devosia neptuniae]